MAVVFILLSIVQLRRERLVGVPQTVSPCLIYHHIFALRTLERVTGGCDLVFNIYLMRNRIPRLESYVIFQYPSIHATCEESELCLAGLSFLTLPT